MTKAVNEEKMITLETGDGERVDFYVLEETRISGMNYLLVTDAPEDFASVAELFLGHSVAGRRIDIENGE